jgi:hypothetical protein
MMSSPSRTRRELHRLLEGPKPDERPEGAGTVRFIVRCPANAPQVLDRAVSVLRVVNQHSGSDNGWPRESEWPELLPAWFVSVCAPERSRQDTEAWLAQWSILPQDEQDRIEREEPWSVSSWTYWFGPRNRQWYWWDARVLDANVLVVAIEVDGWPFPWGALAWLFRAAGAEEVKAEE